MTSPDDTDVTPTSTSCKLTFKFGKEKTMKNAIIEKIKTLDHDISFVDLKDIPGFAGEDVLGWDGVDGQFLCAWAGVSEKAVSSIRELMIDKIITMERTSPLTYLIDGFTLSLPLIEKDPDAKEVWVPHVFNKGEQWVD